ncbi:MAG: hypothetical protein ABJK18_02990, partial [Marinobacter sp.]
MDVFRWLMIGKLRPVGSRVALPGRDDSLALPWEKFYRSEYMGSGTQALSFAVAIAIQGKSKTPDPEVIIPAYGCPDLVAAVVAQNARPVLVDL